MNEDDANYVRMQCVAVGRGSAVAGLCAIKHTRLQHGPLRAHYPRTATYLLPTNTHLN